MQPRSHTMKLSLELGKASVHVLDWGSTESDNTVVCVHGLTRNAHDFDRLAQTLVAQGRRVLALDMPGRGDSPWLENKMLYGYPLYVQACIAVMDNFHMRSVDWIGTSMGGVIGMMIAVTAPSRIRKLVLNDIGARISQEGLTRIIEYVRTLPRHFADEAAAMVYLKQAFAPFGIQDETVWREFVKYSITPHDKGGFRLKTDPDIAEPLRVETKDYTEIQAVDLSRLWEEVRRPTLLIRGAESDLLTEETYRAMLGSNIRAQGRVIEGCGHAPSLTTPEQIGIITRFLEAMPAVSASAIGA